MNKSIIITILLTFCLMSGVNAQYNSQVTYTNKYKYKSLDTLHTPTLGLSTILVRKEVKRNFIPEGIALASVIAITTYGKRIERNVLPANIGVCFGYGAFNMRKEYKNDQWLLPVAASTLCFLIQFLVVTPH